VRTAAFALGILALGVPCDALAGGPPKPAPAPVAFSRIAGSSPVVDHESLVEGCVVDVSQCPPCPPKAECKPCAAPHVTLRQLGPQPSIDELVIHAASPSGPTTDGGAPGGHKEWPHLGHKVRMTVRLRPPQAGKPPVLDLEGVSFADLGVCRTSPPMILVGGAEPIPEASSPAAPQDPSRRPSFSRVAVTMTPAEPPPGTYLLLDTQGPVARLALESARGRADACPYSAVFVVEGGLSRTPLTSDHLVVLGPVQDARATGRLLFRGLATAGHPAGRAPEALGVRAPGGAEPLYAVDTNGDNVADLAMTWVRKFGEVKNTKLDRKEIAESFQHQGREWAMTAHCSWHEADLVGP
jgi:hypothetical protein